MSLIGATNEEKIWNYLYSKLGNAYGVAGIMGNINAESGLKPSGILSKNLLFFKFHGFRHKKIRDSIKAPGLYMAVCKFTRRERWAHQNARPQ